MIINRKIYSMRAMKYYECIFFLNHSILDRLVKNDNYSDSTTLRLQYNLHKRFSLGTLLYLPTSISNE